jgi:hypothetical protein
MKIRKFQKRKLKNDHLQNKKKRKTVRSQAKGLKLRILLDLLNVSKLLPINIEIAESACFRFNLIAGICNFDMAA